LKTLFRIISLSVACCLLLAALCGCNTDSSDGSGFQALFRLDTEESDTPEPSEPEPLSTLSLPYDPNDNGTRGKVLDPFASQTFANRYICQLIYEPLFRITEELAAAPCVAESIKYSTVAVADSAAAYFCVVDIKEGLLFSDGSEITLSDILYSLNMANSKNSVYSDVFSNVISFYKSGKMQVTFRLAKPDSCFEMLLDIPIVKRNAASDNQTFIGSGRYRPIIITDSIHLLKNENYADSNNSTIKLINLIEVEDGDMLMYSLKTGSIDFAFFDMNSDGSYNSASGTQSVQLNNMLFVGFNGASFPTSNQSVRKAISLIVDRSVMPSAYSGMATAVSVPQNPNFPIAKHTPLRQPNHEQAKALLADVGYDSYNKDGILQRRERPLSLTLLVNREDDRRLALAELIKEQLTAAGIGIVVEQCSFNEYLSRLAEGDFDLYLGEIKLKYNMDISALLAGGSAAYHTPTSLKFEEAYTAWRSGGSLATFNTEFENTLPFLPLMFRCGQVSFTRELSYNIIATEKDIFYNIADWE